MRLIMMKLKDSCWVLWTQTVLTHGPPAVTSRVSGYPAARPRRTRPPGRLPQPGDGPRFWLDTGGRASRKGSRWLAAAGASQADLPHNRAKPTEPLRSMSTEQQRRIDGGLHHQPVAWARAGGIHPTRSHERNFYRVFFRASGLCFEERCVSEEWPAEMWTVDCYRERRTNPTNALQGRYLLWCNLSALGDNSLLCFRITAMYASNSPDDAFPAVVFLLPLTLHRI